MQGLGELRQQTFWSGDKHTLDPDAEPKINRINEWGGYGPHATFNVDQVPLPFAVDNKRTLDMKGKERIWIAQLGSDLDKRQATLQLCIRALGQQPIPVIIFRGKAEYDPTKEKHHIANREKEEESYPDDVKVFWQAKAWADTDFCIKWATWFGEWYTADNLDDAGKAIMLADNLIGQTRKKTADAGFQAGFVQALKTFSVLVRFGVAGATHLWQPVDAGVGAEYKRRIGKYYREWLLSTEADQYMEKGTIDLPMRRLLLTRWVHRAWAELEETRKKLAANGKETESIFYKAFR